MTFNFNVNLNNKNTYPNMEEQKCYSGQLDYDDYNDYNEIDCNEYSTAFNDEISDYEADNNLYSAINLFEEYAAEYTDSEVDIDYQEYARDKFSQECANVISSLDSALDIVDTDDLRQNLSNLEYSFDGDLDTSMEKLNAIRTALYSRLESQDNKNAIYAPNGIFDMPSIQGTVGDCWLISGTNSLLTTKKGKEILNKSVTVDNENQTVSVNLAGANKTYEISMSELYSNIENAAGDMDMRALEVAIEKYGLEEGIARNTFYSNGDIKFDETYDLESNYSRTAFNLLIPKEERNTETTYNYNGDVNKKLDEIMNNKGQVAGCLSIMGEENEISLENPAISGSFFGRYKQDKKEAKEFMKNLSKDNTTIFSHHSYSIVNVTKDYVYLVNPWYTDEKIKVPRKELESIRRLRLETQTFKD